MLKSENLCLLGELSVPGFHAHLKINLMTNAISPLVIVSMLDSVTSLATFITDRRVAVFKAAIFLIVVTLEILLVQLVSRYHLNAVLKGHVRPRVMVHSLLHVAQLGDDLLLDADEADHFTVLMVKHLRLDLL